MSTSIVILAAGKGTRLGMPFPKPLTPLISGQTIMSRALDLIHAEFGKQKIHIVVGFKSEIVVDTFPYERYVYNENYDTTNTSKSLLRALLATPRNDGVLWFNGDVVFDDTLLQRLRHLIIEELSFVAVNTARVADEEVKYTINAVGFIDQLSKSIPARAALGEAVGINYVSPSQKPGLISALRAVDDKDYFERAIERVVTNSGARYLPVDISRFGIGAMEVDFQEDLCRANDALTHSAI